MKISIIGDGAWGKALRSVLVVNNNEVSLYGPDELLVASDVFILALPVQFMRDAIKGLVPFKNSSIINTSKGIEKDTHKLPFQIVQEVLGSNISYYSLLGPSFAEEVMSKMPTVVNLGYVSNTKPDEIKNLFQTDYFRVELTEGFEALELSAALKNVYAISCGIAEGLQYGINTKILLMIQALKEITIINDFLNYSYDNASHPALIGDLLLSCSSEESRNFKFGKLMSQKKINESLNELNSTVEGYFTVRSIPYFIEATKKELPLAKFIFESIEKDNPAEIKTNFIEALNTF